MFLSLSFFGLMGTRTGCAGGPIFTIYMSYDILSRKDVPFGGYLKSSPKPNTNPNPYPAMSGATVYPKYLPIFGGSNSQKNRNFGGVNRHFQAKHVKYSNFHIIEPTAPISAKFCTPIKTTKYALWVVQKCRKQIQDGGRLPSLKI